MKSWFACILLLVISAPLWAQTAKSQTTTTTTTTNKPKATAKAKRAPVSKAPSTASEIKTLRDAVNAQQQQIQMLRDELARRDATLQQVQGQVNSLQSTASQAQTTAQTAESASKQNEEALASLKTEVGKTETSATATASALQGTEKKVGVLESPLALKYKGITITPGGFIAAQLNWRKMNQNLDNIASFGAFPFANSTNGQLNEFRLSARYSRLSLLAEGKTKGFNVQGYFEMDFEGAAQTANENQTNSYTPRVREAWANVDGPHGLSFAGGQTWSLLTANRTGVGPRGLMLPAHIDGSLVIGFHYARQNTFRVYKNWSLANKKKFYVAFAVENSETTCNALQFNTAAGAPVNTCNGTLGGLTLFGLQGSPGQPSAAAPNGSFANSLSVDAAPDLVGKVAIEPGWGHFELAAIGRFFRDRVDVTAVTNTASAGTNHTTPGGGVSFNGVLPIVPKKVDIVFETLAGRGVGRYGTTGGPDVTIRPDGTLQPVLGYQGYAGIEVHPHPKLDINIYGGDEYYKRATYITGGTALLPVGIGYGFPNADMRGCNVEIAAGLRCDNNTINKNVYEISPGFWYRFYRGPGGTVQYGMFYEYLHRTPWSGRLDATGAVHGTPTANEHVVFSAFRWYLP